MIMFSYPRLGEKLLNCVLMCSTFSPTDGLNLFQLDPEQGLSRLMKSQTFGLRPNPGYIRILGSDQELVCSRGTCVGRGGGKLLLFNSCMSLYESCWFQTIKQNREVVYLRWEFYSGYMYLGFSSIWLLGVVVHLMFVNTPKCL